MRGSIPDGESPSMSRGVLVLVETKSDRRRDVPMGQAVYDVLSGLRTKRKRPEDAGLVFTRPDGRPLGRLTTGWETALRRAGITNFCFHDLRHTAASHMVMGGASLHETAEILGHSTLQMTRRYSHLATAHLRRVVGLLDEAFGTAARVPASPIDGALTPQR